MNVTYRQASEFLLLNDNYIIVIHDRADGDCFGSSVGLSCILKLLKKNVVIASPGVVPDRLKFINTSNIDVLEGKDALSSFVKDNSTFISTDVASNALITELSDIVESKISLAIDHHRINTLICDKLLVEDSASSTGEVIVELCKMLEAMTDKNLFSYDVCYALYSAISSDSGCFKYSNTGAKTHKFASLLLENCIPAHEINYNLFDKKSRIQIQVEKLAYNNLEFFFDDKLCLIYISKDELDTIGATNNDTETVIQIARSIEGVQIGVFMYEKGPNTFKLSVRTSSDKDMSELCSHFGGGGHKKAAGCTLNATASDVRKTFLDKAKEYIE